MTRAPALALLLLCSGLAGCLAPADMRAATSDGLPSVVKFDVNHTIAAKIPFAAKDGTKLDVWAFRPDVTKSNATDEKVPIIVDIGPYYGNLGGDISKLGAIDQRLADYFVPRGYAVARVSVRGTGNSEGCFDLGGATEQQDIHDVVEALASQPWSNGAVAVLGKSYDGTTPWEAAITHPKGLKTIVPISGITDMYRYTYHDGTTYPENLGFETYYNLLVDQDVDAGPPPTYFGGQNDAQQNLLRTCGDLATQTFWGDQTAASGDHGTDFWRARDYEPAIAKINVPVFLVHGLHDWNVKPDNGVPMFANISAPKAMWLGQWEHNYPDINTYQPAWSRHDWNETLLVWFDHWLKDVDNHWAEVAHVEAQDQAGTWHTSTAWPPSDAQPLTLFLTPQGGLGVTAKTGTLTMANNPQGPAPIPPADSTLRFATGPVARNVTLAGLPTLDVRMSIDRAGGNLGVTWFDIAPNGTWTEWDHGSRELMHRDSRESGSPVVPNAPFATTVNLYPQETTLAAGHSLGIALAPELPAWIEPSPPGTGGTYTIQLGEQGTRLHLVVLADGLDALRSAATGAAPAHAAGDHEGAFVAHEIIK